MESRKRARLEPMATSIDAGVDADSGAAAAHLAGTQSIFLSGDATGACSADAVGVLPPNVFLTICDENSDESQDYLAIDDHTLTHIKQEQHMLDNVPAEPSLPLQYRIVNSLQRQLPQLGGNSSASLGGISATNSGTVNSQLAPMQLPSGCEIYLVKEYVNNGTPTTTTIKIEPDSGVAAVAGGGGGGGSGVQFVRGTMPLLTPKLTSNSNATPINSVATTTTATTTSTAAASAGNGKRSYILEAYKKRDDKRRATHNEVERRRRDKINNWIFKLKEMLPPEMSNQNNVNNNNSTTKNSSTNTNSNCNNGVVASTNDTQQQQQARNASNNNNHNNSNHSRTPPSDSKSQILIKACEYIKAMQDEIKSLRECLTENERLRLSNQRLQNELNKLKGANKNGITTSNGNFNITLNSLNSGGGVLFCTEATRGNGSGSSSGPCTSNNTYTKRELIIRDYVD